MLLGLHFLTSKPPGRWGSATPATVAGLTVVATTSMEACGAVAVLQSTMTARDPAPGRAATVAPCTSAVVIIVVVTAWMIVPAGVVAGAVLSRPLLTLGVQGAIAPLELTTWFPVGGDVASMPEDEVCPSGS
jgi:hypothetical protein